MGAGEGAMKGFTVSLGMDRHAGGTLIFSWFSGSKAGWQGSKMLLCGPLLRAKLGRALRGQVQLSISRSLSWLLISKDWKEKKTGGG